VHASRRRLPRGLDCRCGRGRLPLRGRLRWLLLRCAVRLRRAVAARGRSIRLRGRRRVLTGRRRVLTGRRRVLTGRRRVLAGRSRVLAGRSRVRLCGRPAVALRLWWRCALPAGEVWRNGRAERVHAFGRTKARAIVRRKATSRSRRKAALIRRWRRPSSGWRRGSVGTRRLLRLPRLRRWRRVLTGRGRLSLRCTPIRRGSGRLWSSLRRRAVSRWRGRCGEGIAARQTKLAGGLIRSAAPRARDHLKTPELERWPQARPSAGQHTRFIASQRGETLVFGHPPETAWRKPAPER
jgi:hypothetical protein